MRLVLFLPILLFSFSSERYGKEECLEDSMLTDSLMNVEAAKVILKKFSTSNSPVYNGKYLRHTAKTNFEENKKDGKVVNRDMVFTVVKLNDKGACKYVQVKLRQDAKDDGSFGVFYVESAVPAPGSADCDCVKSKVDWLNRV